MTSRTHAPPPLQHFGQSMPLSSHRRPSSGSSPNVNSNMPELERTHRGDFKDDTVPLREALGSNGYDHGGNGDDGHGYRNSYRDRDPKMTGLGATRAANGNGYVPTHNPQNESRTRSFSSEILAGILIPLPFILASLPHHEQLQPVIPESPFDEVQSAHSTLNHSLNASALSSAALLVTSAVASILQSDGLDRRKHRLQNRDSVTLYNVFVSTFRKMASVFLPFFAAIELGGMTVAPILLLTASSGLGGILSQVPDRATLKILGKYKYTLAMIFLSTLVHFTDNGLSSGHGRTFLGWLALYVSIFMLPSPILPFAQFAPQPSSTTDKRWETPPSTPDPVRAGPTSTSVASLHEGKVCAIAGYVLAGIWTILYMFSHGKSLVSKNGLISFSLSTASITTSVFFVRPSDLKTVSKLGVASGSALIVVSRQLLYSGSWPTALLFSSVLGLAYLASLIDGKSQSHSEKHHGLHDSHHHHKEHSKFTGFLLSITTPGSVLHSVLLERDSRRIAYFGCLNLAFMLVQFFYGFATGSLGLLTDSIHMLFDCLGLGVGLAAAVMSKWPSSLNFPYGYGKIDTLAGFANGIFLVLVSVEIIFDALHRLRDGHELRRLNELLIVSTLGFLVNIVGLTAFGHAHHHGHDHGHDHGHSHSHAHSGAVHSDNHDHSHSHIHNHEHPHLGYAHSSKSANGTTPSLPPTPFSIPPSPLPPPSHSHDNENMQGIFLHILADALGSVAVIFSTLLTKWNGWNGWDPLASCAIAILIFLSAIPLVKSSGRRLLLALPDDLEYSCRGVLQGISELRGVVGYAGVKFWKADQEGSGGHLHHSHDDSGHGHHHGHDHGEYEHCSTPSRKGQIISVLGVMHIIAAKNADLEDVRERAEQYLKSRGMDIVLQVDREGDGKCWCGGKRG